MEIIYTLFTPQDVLEFNFHPVLKETTLTAPQYNIRPGMVCSMLYSGHARARTQATGTWGIEPDRILDGVAGTRAVIPAGRIEHHPPFVKMFQRKRCIVPANGFFLVKTMGDLKLPFYMRLLNHTLFGLAGLYEIYTQSDGTTNLRFSLISCPSNDLIKPVSDEMPVILTQEAYDAWLDPIETDKHHLNSLLNPYPFVNMAAYRAGSEVLDSENDSETVIQPYTE